MTYLNPEQECILHSKVDSKMMKSQTNPSKESTSPLGEWGYPILESTFKIIEFSLFSEEISVPRENSVK